MLAIRLIPPALMADFRTQAQDMTDRPKSRLAMTLIVLLWLGLTLLVGLWALRRFA